MQHRFILSLFTTFKSTSIVCLLVLSGLSSQHVFAKGSVYSELLDNCAKEIYNNGFNSDNVVLKLERKIEKGPSYRFWINIENTEAKTSASAYCKGKKKGGVVTEFKISN